MKLSFGKMILRSGKSYTNYVGCWWYQYTIEACQGKNNFEKEDYSLFAYNQYTIQFWLDNIVSLYEYKAKVKS